MLQKMRQRAKDEEGFTLIELLVVILIIGILAAIAIPSFINQKGKANDASAKELARTAETVAETYATDNSGAYTGLATSTLVQYEPSINSLSTTGQAYAAVVAAGSNSYTVDAESPQTTDIFSIIRSSTGAITRQCTPAGTGGCPAATGSNTYGTW
jgi:type IV pilus assembly protein PilA